MLQNLHSLRLDSLQQKALDNALDGVAGAVYLFGSRAKSGVKGGDVDLLVISSDNAEKRLETTMLITRRYQSICDERIDVVVFPGASGQSKEQRAFLNHINKVRIR